MDGPKKSCLKYLKSKRNITHIAAKKNLSAAKKNGGNVSRLIASLTTIKVAPQIKEVITNPI